MKKLFTFIAVIICSVPVFAQEVEKAKNEEGEKTYTVKKGDTLWDISDEFLKDPFKWPGIWEVNPGIRNPHLIYPGQEITIRPSVEEVEEKAPPPVPEAPKEVVRAEPEVVPPPVEEKAPEIPPPPPAPPAPPRVTFSYPGIERIGFIDTITPLGSIIGSKEDKVMLAYGDEVYMDIGEGKGAKAGERYNVYREPKPIYHPVSGRLLGHQVTIVGVTEVIKTHERLSEGKVVVSYDFISKGDRTARYEPVPADIEVKKAGASLDGIVVGNGRGSVEAAEGDLVFLDIGKKKGIEVGNTLAVYIPEKVIDKKKGLSRPVEDIGRLLVLSAQDETSTALVIGSKKSIHIGDRVRAEDL